ncbi:MAG: restriction endonuclease [Bacteroidales bacterium]|nr:restriction endonuclease [Bacteroidales bacterium]
MKKPKFIRWFKPLLEVLLELGSATPNEVTQRIAEKESLDEELLNKRYLKTGVLIFNNQVAFARQYLIWEGYLTSSSRGVWSLTDKGIEKARTFNEEEAYNIYKKWISLNRKIKPKKKIEENSEETIIVYESEESNELENTSLLEILKKVSPEGFEKLCGELLRNYNFEDIIITQLSHDGGIDGYATLKINPFIKYQIAFQCKRYEGSVPTKDVHAFCSVAENKDRMLFITTGNFSKEARKIEQEKKSKLELIDGQTLEKMFQDIQLGVNTKTVYVPDISFFERYF